MRKHRAGSVWMILPLYLFTLIFVALPLLYVVALSFSTADGGYGVNWKFTLDNYKQILEPVYLQTFTGSFRLALTSTLIICLVGYPFGYFMAKLSEGKKKLAMLFLMLPFWVNSLIRLYGWIIILQKKGLLNYLLMKLGIIQEPLKILYCARWQKEFVKEFRRQGGCQLNLEQLVPVMELQWDTRACVISFRQEK